MAKLCMRAVQAAQRKNCHGSQTAAIQVPIDTVPRAVEGCLTLAQISEVAPAAEGLGVLHADLHAPARRCAYDMSR